MKQIHKRLVVDEHGNPQEVLIPWKEFREIEEILGLDLDAAAIADLEQSSARPGLRQDGRVRWAR